MIKVLHFNSSIIYNPKIMFEKVGIFSRALQYVLYMRKYVCEDGNNTILTI